MHLLSCPRPSRLYSYMHMPTVYMRPAKGANDDGQEEAASSALGRFRDWSLSADAGSSAWSTWAASAESAVRLSPGLVAAVVVGEVDDDDVAGVVLLFLRIAPARSDFWSFFLDLEASATLALPLVGGEEEFPGRTDGGGRLLATALLEAGRCQ
jgi:hypothetical protein